MKDYAEYVYLEVKTQSWRLEQKKVISNEHVCINISWWERCKSKLCNFMQKKLIGCRQNSLEKIPYKFIDTKNFIENLF